MRVAAAFSHPVGMTADTSAIVVRELSPADAEAALEVSRLCDVAEIGQPDTDLEDVLEWLDPTEGRSFGVAGQSELDAYAWVSKRVGHLAIDMDVRVRPGASPALGPLLLDVARRAAGGIDLTRPLHVFVHADDAVRREWLTAVGGRAVRHFWRMVIDLDGDVPAPVVPAGAVIRSIDDIEEDVHAVADVVHTAFQDHFGHESGHAPSYDEFVTRTHQASGFDITLWWLAFVDRQPAAALIGRHFDNGGFVNTLGTLTEFRGRGLGRALLLSAFGEFKRRGLPSAFLGVDATNPTGAVRLYESAGMRAEHSWAVMEVDPLPGDSGH